MSLRGQDVIQEGGFAWAQEACQDGDWHLSSHG